MRCPPYDPVRNSWTAKAPLPTRRYGYAVGVAKGTLYVVGGNTGIQGCALVTPELPNPAPQARFAAFQNPLSSTPALGIGVLDKTPWNATNPPSIWSAR